jgi:hypothetical protein
MLTACSGVQGEEVEVLGDGSQVNLEVVQNTEVQGAIDRLDKQTIDKLEVNNKRIASRIGALLERVSKAERKQRDIAHVSGTETEFEPLSPRSVKSNKSNARARLGVDFENVPRADNQGGTRVPDPLRQLWTAGKDPDHLRPYAIFLAITQKNISCLGIHTWSLCAATRANRSFAGAISALIPSILLLVLQCFVLHAISVDSLHPPCTSNAECHAGMWCAPSRSTGGFTMNPGMCDDCKWAGLLNAQDYDNLYGYDADAYQAASGSLANAVAYCNVDDIHQDTCDFVVSFRKQMTVGALFVFIFVTWLVLLSYVVEMDRQTQITDVFEFRLKHISSFEFVQAEVIKAIGWLIFNFRKFILPSVVAYSYVSLVLATPSLMGLSLPVSFIVAGLAVGFVYNVDSFLAWALLDRKSQALIREAFADMEAHQDRDEDWDPLAEAWLPYFGNRLLAVSFGFLIMFLVLGIETMMKEMPMWSANPSPKTCTNVQGTLGMATGLLMTLLALVWASVNVAAGTVCRWTSAIDIALAPAIVLLVLPLIALLSASLGYSPI